MAAPPAKTTAGGISPCSCGVTGKSHSQRQAGRGASDEVLQCGCVPHDPGHGAGTSYIVAARRTALGRPGGLHRSRRIESLTAPVVLAALEDAKLEASCGRADHPRQYHRGRQSRPYRRPCRGPERQRARPHRRPPVRLRPRCDPARPCAPWRWARPGSSSPAARNRYRRRRGGWRGPRACSRRRGSSASSPRTGRPPIRRTRSRRRRSWRGGSASPATGRTATLCTRI